MVTSESSNRFDAVSAELLNWILKSKPAIQTTEIKEYMKMQDTSEMKKKLKVKNINHIYPTAKIVHHAGFSAGIKTLWNSKASCKINVGRR